MSSAVVEPASGTRSVVFAERQSFPERRVLGQLVGLTPANSSTTPRIEDLRGRLPEGSNLQGSCENGFWLDFEFNGDMLPEASDQVGPWSRDSTDPPVGWQCLASAVFERTYLQGTIWPKLSPAETSSGPSVVHLLASRSLVHQWWSSRVWNLRSFGFCSFVAFGAPSLSLLTPAHATVPLTCVAITGQLVGGQGCWGFEGSRWNAQQPVSAVRQGGVSVNVRVADPPPGRIDDRKIEVVADGLPHFHGARLAVDTTLADGNARRQCADHDGAALQQARRKKETTYPELARPRGGRARLVVLG